LIQNYVTHAIIRPEQAVPCSQSPLQFTANPPNLSKQLGTVSSSNCQQLGTSSLVAVEAAEEEYSNAYSGILNAHILKSEGNHQEMG
jgi:hypothetical protein